MNEWILAYITCRVAYVALFGILNQRHCDCGLQFVTVYVYTVRAVAVARMSKTAWR